jgi:predicted amidohydrolase
MAPTIKVAVIQLHPKPLQPEINFSKAVEFVRSAASQGAQLAVLPEYHLTNWKPNDPEFLAVVEQCGGYLEKYCKLAKECNICKSHQPLISPSTKLSRLIQPSSPER